MMQNFMAVEASESTWRADHMSFRLVRNCNYLIEYLVGCTKSECICHRWHRWRGSNQKSLPVAQLAVKHDFDAGGKYDDDDDDEPPVAGAVVWALPKTSRERNDAA